MRLRDALALNTQAHAAVTATATCRDSLMFADLCWEPFDPQHELQRYIELGAPGVMFETPSRIVVLEEHAGELRYYAGGWRSHESRIHLEEERITAEGCEAGVFATPRDAIVFAECFLTHEQALQDIATPRTARYRQDTDKIGRLR